eukprot:scaffold4402_cov25-Tisochrysis_lutea.AAC.1
MAREHKGRRVRMGKTQGSGVNTCVVYNCQQLIHASWPYALGTTKRPWMGYYVKNMGKQESTGKRAGQEEWSGGMQYKEDGKDTSKGSEGMQYKEDGKDTSKGNGACDTRRLGRT